MSLPSSQRAAQFDPRDQKIHINTIPLPTPKAHELLIKTAACSLCHSDLMHFESNEVGLKLGDGAPFTLGHEATGTIISCGADTKGFKPGDEVGFLPSSNICHVCDECQIHHIHCETLGGVKIPGFAVDGFFQEYLAVDFRNAMVLPKGMDMTTAAPLFCAGVTSFHGVQDCGLKEGDFLAIVGVGGLGHLGVQYAKAMGLKVVAIDISDSQLAEALKCGADHAFNSKTCSDYAAQIKSLTGGGCHAVVNFTNSKVAYDMCPSVLRINGILMVVGIPQAPLTFNAMDISMGKFRVYGASNSIPSRMVPCIEFSNEHNIVPHVTYFELDRFQEMVDLMHKGGIQGRLAVKF